MKIRNLRFIIILFFLISLQLYPNNFMSKKAEAAGPWTSFLESTINYTGGIQIWSPRTSGTYKLDVYGASGGYRMNYTNDFGRGAYVSGYFDLAPTDNLRILVGSKGKDATSSFVAGSGGGGTFVTKIEPTGAYTTVDGVTVTPLIIAGGGAGGAQGWTSSINGQATTAGNGEGGRTGSRYDDDDWEIGGQGGAGFVGNGNGDGTTAKSYINGGNAGIATSPIYGLDGGFGGGGTSNRNNSGGGGGWIGGSGGLVFTGGLINGYNYAGSGGGSYNIGANPTGTSGYNTGDGRLQAILTVPVEPKPEFSNIGTSSVTLNFPSENPDGLEYRVYRSLDGATNWVYAGNTLTKQFVDTGLAELTYYYYKVYLAYNGYNSGYTQVYNTRTKAEATEAARNAETAAKNAETTMNTIISPKLDVLYDGVIDSSGNTAISMANAAKVSADLASQNASIQ